MLLIRIINDQLNFHKLRDDWNSLLKNSNSDNIFLTWEWVYSWWETYSEKKELFIVIVEENGRLIGVAPLYFTKVAYFGIRTLRHIEFIGTTDTYPEYLDFILLKGREKELTYNILDRLYNSSNIRWDVLNLVSMRQDSENLNWCRNYLYEKNHNFSVYATRECPFIMLPTTMDEFFKDLNENTRYKFRKFTKNLMRDYTVSMNRITDKEELEKSFEVFVNLHQKRWKEKKGKGSFGKNRIKYTAFHKKIISYFFEMQWLYLVFLKVKEEIVSAQYNFLYCNKLYCYQVGFEPVWGKYNVATVLQLMVVEDAISRKLSEFDFLRGTEEYKFYWTKVTRKTLDIVLWRSKITYSITKVEKKLRGIIKFVLPKWFILKLYNRLFSRTEK